MTIAIGFLCGDGIVLGADTQLTAQGSHKSWACKLSTLSSSSDPMMWSAIFTYAGHPIFMESFKNRFRDEMRHAENEGWPLTPALVRDTITNILKVFDYSESSGTELLCGIVLPDGETKLFKTKGTIVSEIDRYSYIGVGDSSLLEYLMPLLSSKGINSSQQAALIGVHVIRSAKAYIDGCGGNTDIWVLKPSGTLVAHSHSTTLTVEHRLGMIEHFMGEAMSELYNTTEPSDFNQALARSFNFDSSEEFVGEGRLGQLGK